MSLLAKRRFRRCGGDKTTSKTLCPWSITVLNMLPFLFNIFLKLLAKAHEFRVQYKQYLDDTKLCILSPCQSSNVDVLFQHLEAVQVWIWWNRIYPDETGRLWIFPSTVLERFRILFCMGSHFPIQEWYVETERHLKRL